MCARVCGFLLSGVHQLAFAVGMVLIGKRLLIEG